jgi:hypothetical protein
MRKRMMLLRNSLKAHQQQQLVQRTCWNAEAEVVEDLHLGPVGVRKHLQQQHNVRHRSQESRTNAA